MEHLKIIRVENKKEGELIEINNRPYNIKSQDFEKSQLLESLKIMPIIGRNIKHFFQKLHLLKEINKLAVEQQEIINNLNQVQNEKPLYREDDKKFYSKKIIQNTEKIIKIIDKIFEGLNESIPDDLYISFSDYKRLNPFYQETFFKNNRWFEIIIRECVRYVIEEVIGLKKCHYKLYVNKEVFGSEDTPFEIDVILIVNNTLTIFQCKSGNKRQVTREDIVYFKSIRELVSANRGIFVLLEAFNCKNMNLKQYERSNIFLIDKLFSMNFEDFITKLTSCIEDLVQE